MKEFDIANVIDKTILDRYSFLMIPMANVSGINAKSYKTNEKCYGFNKLY